MPNSSLTNTIKEINDTHTDVRVVADKSVAVAKVAVKAAGDADDAVRKFGKGAADLAAQIDAHTSNAAKLNLAKQHAINLIGPPSAAAGGGRKKKSKKSKRYIKSPKGKRLVRKGPRGGKYIILNGKKKYLTKK